MESADTVVLSNIDQVIIDMKAAIANRKVNLSTFMLLVPRCMEIVEKIPTLTGPEKKALVLEVLARLVEELPIDEEDKQSLKLIVTTVVPVVVDTIVSSALGQFAINVVEEIEEEVTGCFAKCSKKKDAEAASRRIRHRHVIRK